MSIYSFYHQSIKVPKASLTVEGEAYYALKESNLFHPDMWNFEYMLNHEQHHKEGEECGLYVEMILSESSRVAGMSGHEKRIQSRNGDPDGIFVHGNVGNQNKAKVGGYEGREAPWHKDLRGGSKKTKAAKRAENLAAEKKAEADGTAQAWVHYPNSKAAVNLLGVDQNSVSRCANPDDRVLVTKGTDGKKYQFRYAQ